MSSTAPTRAEQVAWLKDNLPLFPKTVKEQITKTLALGDALPDIAISGIYDANQATVKEALDKKNQKIKIRERANELWQEAIAAKEQEETEEYFETDISEDGEERLYLRDEDNAGFIAWCLDNLFEEKEKLAKEELAPVIKKKTGKKNSGTRRQAGEADEWFINTEEDAKADYKEGVWATDADIKKKSVYRDQMKKYNIGDNDPRPDKTGKLEKPLVKFQYKACVRTDNIQDEDEFRCKGAVAWKAGRYGCAYAGEKGFKGSVMAQCSETTTANGWCAKCAKKKVNYYDKENLYKKSKIIWSEAWSGEGEFKQL